MSGYVYIFDVGDGWLKLGTSINWGCRLAELRYWHKEVSVIQTWEMGSRSACRVERLSHSILRKKKTPQNGDEVYKIPKSSLIRIVREAMKTIEKLIGLDKELDHNKGCEYTDEEIKAALKKAGTDKGAARLLGCKAITIKRRRQMWAEGRKLQLSVKK